MNMKSCPKGHYYDADRYVTCPVCEEERKNGESVGSTESVPGGGVIGATEPVGGSSFSGGIGVTEPVNIFDRDNGETQPPTMPLSGSDMMRQGGMIDESDTTQPYNPSSVPGIVPVVGWLVCIDGPDKGRDFRIHTGYNQIGRAEYMDICIHGDQKISREKHALVAYDNEEKVFFFGPSEGRNIVRLNGKMVMVPTEIHPYDVLTVGSSKLIFIPLCGEKFDW